MKQVTPNQGNNIKIYPAENSTPNNVLVSHNAVIELNGIVMGMVESFKIEAGYDKTSGTCTPKATFVMLLNTVEIEGIQLEIEKAKR
jgi:hypothetical protein